MMTWVLNGYIGFLTIFFVIAMIIILVASIRARISDTKTVLDNEPIPDLSQRNYHTRRDKDVQEEKWEVEHDESRYRGAISQNDKSGHH